MRCAFPVKQGGLAIIPELPRSAYVFSSRPPVPERGCLNRSGFNSPRVVASAVNGLPGVETVSSQHFAVDLAWPTMCVMPGLDPAKINFYFEFGEALVYQSSDTITAPCVRRAIERLNVLNESPL